MKKKFLLLFVILVLVNLFIYYGMPFLKDFRESRDARAKISLENPGFLTERPVTVDISVESLCLNMITDELYEKCTSAEGCDETCREDGCKLFSLVFVSSNFSEGRCLCNCYEENKIKKALSTNQDEEPDDW